MTKFGSAAGWTPETSNPGMDGSDGSSANIGSEADFFKKIIEMRGGISGQWAVASNWLILTADHWPPVTQNDCETQTDLRRRGKDFRDSGAHDAGTRVFPLGLDFERRDQAEGFRHSAQKLPNPPPPCDAYTRPLMAAPQSGAEQGNNNPDTQHSEKGFGSRGDDDDADTQGGKAHQFGA